MHWQRGRWHVSFSVEIAERVPPARGSGRVVGVDLGLTELAVLSTGERVANPRHLEAGVLASVVQTRRTRQDPPNRWRKARARADQIQTTVAAQRRDGLHNLTTALVTEHNTVVIEDLAVANLVRDRRLARHIASASWAELRRQLAYKAANAGVCLVVAARWFASKQDLLGDVARRKPSWPCPSGPTCARRAASCSTETSTPRSTWPL